MGKFTFIGKNWEERQSINIWSVEITQSEKIDESIIYYDFATKINNIINTKEKEITISDLWLWDTNDRIQEFVDWLNSDKKNIKWYAENYWKFDLDKWLFIEDEKKISDNDKAESVAESLNIIFNNSSSVWEKLDIMKGEWWKELIRIFVLWRKNLMKSFDMLRQYLKKYELELIKPSSVYFLEEDLDNSGAYITLSPYWNRLKDFQEKEKQRLQQKAESLAKYLFSEFNDLLISWKKMNIMRDEKRRSQILNLVKWEKNPRDVFDVYLKEALDKYGISFSRVSYDYYLIDEPSEAESFSLFKK